MAIVHSALLQQAKIAGGVEKAMADLASDVVRIRYDLGENWSGDDAIFFRVVLKDAATKRPLLRQVAQRVSDLIVDEIQPQELGLQAYFNFRSESEVAELKEEAWD